MVSGIANEGLETALVSPEVVLNAADQLPPIENASLLFRGDFSRVGTDLLINHEDHGSLRIVRYFDQDVLPSLYAADGAVLDGRTAGQLAGPQAPGQYAQAGAGLTGTPIGTVQSHTGSVTAQRVDGTSVTLAPGDPVYQGDVVQTAGGSSVAIVFVDDTLFSLSADARMVLDELVYSPNGSGNSMVMNLVQGSFVFVTGQVAPTGDMRVETPTATMGIRGTTPIVQINSIDGSTRFSLSQDPDGQTGSYQLFDRLTGQFIGTIDATDESLFIGNVGAQPVITLKTQAEIDAEQTEIQRAFDAYRAAFGGQPGPDDGNGNNGTPFPDGSGAPGDDPDRTDSGPVNGLRDPSTNPIGPTEQITPLNDTNQGGGNQGMDLLNPGTPPAPQTPVAPEGQNQTQVPPDVTTDAPTDDLSLILPDDPIQATEDQTITITDVRVQVPNDGVASVTIVADSSVTLAQTTGLTFTTGDGLEDMELSFTGTEAAINAALNGLMYTPGPDSEEGALSITLYDGTTFSVTEVPIVIQPVNDPPTVFDLSLTVDENGSVTAPFTGFDPDTGDMLTLSSLSDPELGTLQIFEDGTFTFDTNGQFDALSAGEIREVTFEYSAFDGTLFSDSAQVTLNVTGINDDPILASGSASATEDGSPVRLDLATLADDPDGEDDGTSLTYSSGSQDGLPAGVSFDGTALVLDPSDSAFQALSIGETATLEVPVVATDSRGATATNVVSFTVSGTNDAPALAAGQLSAAENGSPVTLDLATLGSDPDSEDDGTSLTYSVDVEELPAGVSVNGAVLTLDPSDDAFQSLSSGETSTFDVSVIATDSRGATATNIVSFTVSGTNNAPELAAGTSPAATEDGAQVSFDLTVLGSDPDSEDNGTSLTYSVAPGELPAGISFDGTVLTLDPSGRAFQALSLGETTTLEVPVLATDSRGATATNIVSFTVSGINDAPALAGGELSAPEGGTPVTLDLATLGSDPDGEDDGASLTYSVVDQEELPEGISFTGSVLTLDPSGNAFQALSLDESTSFEIAVTATDSRGAGAQGLVTVTVAGTNDAPVLLSTDPLAATEDGALVTFDLTTLGSDPDSEDDGTSLTYSAVDANLPAGVAIEGSAVTFDPSNSAYQALSEGETDTVTVSFEATDSRGASTEGTVDFLVTGVDDDAVVSGDATGTVTEKDITEVSTVSGSIAVFDTDTADKPTFAGAMTVGEFGSIAVNEAGDTWTYTLDQTLVQQLTSDDTVTDTLVLTDGDGNTHSVTITINGTDDEYELLESFENGLPENWRALNAYAEFSGSDGDYSVVLDTAGEASSYEAILDFFGPLGAEIEALGNGIPESGAALEGTLELSSAGTIFFDFRFNTEDYLPFNDFALVTLNGEVVELADVAGVDTDGEPLDGVVNLDTTGWVSSFVTIAEAGTYKLGFGVFDVGDDFIDSWLEVDNIRFDPLTPAEDGLGFPYDPVADNLAAGNPEKGTDLAATALSPDTTAVPVQHELAGTALTYAFPSGDEATAYSAAQKAAAVAALAAWTEATGLTVSEAADGDPATISFLNSTDVGYAEARTEDGVTTILTNPDYAETLAPEAGSYGYLTLLHEIGHAFGLDHAPDGVTQAHSVMSYDAPDSLGVDWWNDAGEWVNPQTPMVADLASLQSLYGADPETRADDTVYGFNSTETGTIHDFDSNPDPVLTIYDADGVDALDFSGWDTPALIDLNPGAFSSANGMTNNIAIAEGTIIEKAIGGAGDDLLIGSSLSDTLDGGAGSDTLIGGLGSDTFVLSNDDAADIIADFEIGTDRLDLQSLLDANFGTGAQEDYLRTEATADGTVISVDRDGSADAHQFQDVAVLQSVEAGGIIDFIFSDNGVQAPDTIAA